MPRTPVTIRPARPEDEHAIGALHVSCLGDMFAGLLGTDLPPAEERAARERSWTGPIGFPRDRHALLVAGRGGQVLGFVAVGPTRDSDDDAAVTGELRTVMVDAQERGTGAGAALIAAGERAMRDSGLRVATLWVVPSNAPAVRCYERGGWAPDGAERIMEIAGRRIGAVRYRKALGP